jgi:hypothetical protein
MGETMGNGKLNIWVRYEPEVTWSCRVDDKNEWYVTIKDCTGRIVERCGKPMSWIGPTECGHLEVEVPPGCYVMSAISRATSSNIFTAPAFAQVGCGETACVNLLAPIAHDCAWYSIAGLRQGVREGIIPENVAEKAIGAIKEALVHMKKPRTRLGEMPLEKEIGEAEKFLKERAEAEAARKR